MNFKEIYKKHMEAEGHTPHSWLNEIAEVACVSPFTVYQWAKGWIHPSKASAKLIAAHLGQTEEELFGERRAV